MSANRPLSFILALLIAIGLGTGAAADQVWIAADDQAQAPPQVLVTASDNTSISLEVGVPGFSIDRQKTRGGDFLVLDWPGANPSGAIGSPALPVIRELFIAPMGAEVSVAVQGMLPLVVDAQTLGFDFQVMPRQAPVPKIKGAFANAPFAFDPAVYSTAGQLPLQQATVTELGIARGQRLMLLEVSPLVYSPAAGRIAFTPRMNVQIDFQGGETTRTTMRPLPGLLDNVLNPGLAGQQHNTLRGTGNYLVIVASTLAGHAKMTEFVNAKTAQGFTVTTYSVPGGTSNTAIKSYISGLWGGANSPDYILLVGDSDTIPGWTGGGAGNPYTDLPYACMDAGDDWTPDIAIGRFPADDGAELTVCVDKTLSFDNGVFADAEYTARACFMASVDNYTISEGTHNYVVSNHMDPNGIVSEKLYQVTYGATTQDVRNAFNSGKLYGCYSGHGATTYWADGPEFTQSDVNNLTNYQMYSWVLSFACITGTFSTDECFMETWILAADKGAVAAWGSSVNSYWTEDDVLEKRLFDTLWDDDVRELGPLYNTTKIVYAGEMGTGSTTRRYFEMYNHMGDPALFIPYAIQTAMTVTPNSPFDSEGQSGGPFTPVNKVYTIENTGVTGFNYTVSKTQSWVTLSSTGGYLAAGATANITASINSAANGLADGGYTDTVSFVNTTNHDGDTARGVSLQVGVPVMQYEWNMDTNPGWTTAGQWAYGSPTGGGGAYGNPDPTSGATGSSVYGYNLAGDYENSMSETHLTTTAIDCTDLADVSVRFQRYLNVETPSYDHAYLRVSNNGSSWTTVWENSAEVTDSAWSMVEYDISDVADGESTVYLRWTMGVTDSSWTYSGWNIDDVQIYALGGGTVVPTDTVEVSIGCTPDNGVLPFTTQMAISLTNLTTENRRAAGRVDMVIANGTPYTNWRAGWTNLSDSETYSTFWNQSLPALGSLVGNNVFTIVGVDVTPAPYNQPPFAPAGDTDNDACTVVATSP